MLWHKKLGAWLPPGGHIDPNELPEDAAVREVREETGLEVELLGTSQQLGSVDILIQPICILLEDIQPHHQHIDLIYFLLDQDVLSFLEDKFRESALLSSKTRESFFLIIQ